MFDLIVEHSQAFQEFLDLIGDQIELKGWPHYRGGLDVNSKSQS